MAFGYWLLRRWLHYPEGTMNMFFGACVGGFLFLVVYGAAKAGAEAGAHPALEGVKEEISEVRAEIADLSLGSLAARD